MAILILLPVLYSIIDHFLADLKPLLKYFTSITVSLLIIIALFYPFLINPFQLYHEPEFSALDKLTKYNNSLVQELNRSPSDQEIAQRYYSDKSNKLNFDAAFKTVTDLRPYLQEGGSTRIFWKPLYQYSIYINTIALVLIAVFLYCIFKLDKPYHAYLDKILILLFVYIALDIFHVYGYMYSYSLEHFRAIFMIGQYFTVLCLLVMVYVFDLKLRFVLSTTGKYYEKVLASEPGKVTRWRDEIDSLILKAFFNKKFLNQLGITRTKKDEVES